MIRPVLKRMRSTSFRKEGDERKSGAKPEVLKERATAAAYLAIGYRSWGKMVFLGDVIASTRYTSRWNSSTTRLSNGALVVG